MVCRRQKRVNDQRRRIMQRQAESHHQNFEPRVYSIHGAFHHLPGGGIPQVFMPEDIYRNAFITQHPPFNLKTKPFMSRGWNV